MECDNFQIAVLMNWVEYRKHKTLRSITSKIPFNIGLLRLIQTYTDIKSFVEPTHALYYILF
jgi:hypothetical protein